MSLRPTAGIGIYLALDLTPTLSGPVKIACSISAELTKNVECLVLPLEITNGELINIETEFCFPVRLLICQQ